jgi:hypothetical protein
MSIKPALSMTVAVLFVLCVHSLAAVAGPPSQQPGNSPASGSQSAAPPSAVGTSSLSFDLHGDKSLNNVPPKGTLASVVCFTAKPINSATQPVILSLDEAEPSCVHSTDVAPLRMGSQLYIRIDFSAIDAEAWPDFKILTLAVSTTAGSPINPTPIRAGISQSATTQPGAYRADFAAEGADAVRIKYLRWPYPLAGDTSVNLTVNVLYTPPNSLAAYVHREYPVGSVLPVSDVSGCYAAKVAVSASSASSKSPDQDSINWSRIAGCSASPWSSGTDYPAGSVTTLGATVTIPDASRSCFAAKNRVSPGGQAPDIDTNDWVKAACNAPTWSPVGTYDAGAIVSIGQPVCYVATVASTPPSEASIRGSANWQRLNSCPAAPQSSTSEATVALINQTLPSVHAISKFNLTAGVVYSSIRNRTFGFEQSKTSVPMPCAVTPAATTLPAVDFNCVQTSSNHIVDPVLFLTYYPWGIDAERPWQWSDLRPGFSLGVSLSSPSSNFYVGAMHEIVRNVQFVWGFTAAKTPHLAPNTIYNAPPSAMATTPATVQRFDTGYYVGLSFNILGFIQSLTGGGGGGSAAAAASPSH